MDKYERLIIELEQNFLSFKKPKTICKPTFTDTAYKQNLEFEFKHKTRDNLNYDDCTRLLFEAPLLSDEAYLHFVPRLAKAAFIEDANAFFLYNHLEKINQNILTGSQKILLQQLIIELKQIEANCEAEILQETEQSWREWEETQRNNNTVTSRFLYAVATNQFEEVQQLLKQDITLLNAKDSNNHTVFDIAKMREHQAMLQFLEQVASQST
ncbi:hypothetical protein [Candidatus Albibeggiatoa sp. nov. NOAA]|uniref:hypothetical protein n=1 Tax=Candidatus Albibeggiatoa sp. nov. NOAA TaxID=3162724 RepID=UPI003303C350|nr:hypothetical protein [Thiotrichaceae bacterium]